MGIDRLLHVIEDRGWQLKDAGHRRGLSWDDISQLPKVEAIEQRKDYILVPQSYDVRYASGFGPCLEIDRFWPGLVDYRVSGKDELHFNRLYVATDKFTLALSLSTVFNKNPDAAMLDNSMISRTFEKYFRIVEPLKYAI